MKRFFILFFLSAFIFGANAQTFKMNNKRDLKTAKGVAVTFFRDINRGKYEDSLTLFKNDPVAANELSLEEYKRFVDENITNGRKIKKIFLTEKDVEDNENQLEYTITIFYKDKSEKEKWVIVEKVEGVWKLTTRGSLF
ncbi:MAG: hypothetical protein KA885_06505 [Spirochaetes bacterium]|nr:hypothetical protein [Spirochaetota bacterium]